MERLEKKDLYDPAVYDACRARIEQLQADTTPQWGRMNAAQMLAHCAEVMEVYNGKPMGHTPWIARLLKGMIKKMILSDKPYPRSSRTHPQFVTADDRDFDAEKARMLAALEAFQAAGRKPSMHPLFGQVTPEEKSWAMYKHLDHHLTQFGA